MSDSYLFFYILSIFSVAVLTGLYRSFEQHALQQWVPPPPLGTYQLLACTLHLDTVPDETSLRFSYLHGMTLDYHIVLP